jgi:prephenate dehydrogenase
MAGKERDGIDNADPAIYRDTGLILCPMPGAKPESVDLMRALAAHIGATRLALCHCDRHDAIIAYTSDLMHIAAAGLCMDFHPDMRAAFTAGAFRDCTRIADINAAAWTELLLANASNTQATLDTYIKRLQSVRDALADRDEKTLFRLLEQAGRNKREMLQR